MPAVTPVMAGLNSLTSVGNDATAFNSKFTETFQMLSHMIISTANIAKANPNKFPPVVKTQFEQLQYVLFHNRPAVVGADLIGLEPRLLSTRLVLSASSGF